MRELKQDWRDLFGGFKVAFDIWKLVLAFLGLALTILCFWGMGKIDARLAMSILAGLVIVGLFVKFATSETGLTAKKLVGLVGILVILAGLVLLLITMFENKIIPIAHLFLLLVIWALFGGAISRIAVVEICTDDRLSIGEALCFARRRYSAYLGSTVLPLIAVGVILLCCFAYGLLFTIPWVNVILSALFFVVILAAFMMTLIALGGIAGAPLMYPAISAEGNDAFDAISRSYSYVYGRPWRYLFYNLMAFIYGIVCVLFVGMFVVAMLWLSTSGIRQGADRVSSETVKAPETVATTEGGETAPVSTTGTDVAETPGRVWSDQVAPRVLKNVNVVLMPALAAGDDVTELVDAVDPIGFVWGLSKDVMIKLRKGVSLLGENPDVGDSSFSVKTSAVLISITIYGLLALVLSYVVSLFFSLQSSIYLLLRKAVDGADVTEVFLEEEMEDETPVREPVAEAKKA